MEEAKKTYFKSRVLKIVILFLIKNVPSIITVAFIVQTFLVSIERLPMLSMILSYLFGLSIVPLLAISYYAFTEYRNYINKVCSVGNIILSTTNFIYLFNGDTNLVVLVNRLFTIEIVVIAIISIYLTIRRYDRDNKRTITKSNQK